ncbi:MAG: lysophospholipid acyltransferase family protein [Phycisphaerae bacterium]|nr:lysophospholipid acyltransferase family protein [Phycisphaerae bacterium]
MWNPLGYWLGRWRDVRAAAKNRGQAVRFVVEYVALRSWAMLISCFPVETNLRTARLLGRIWWKLTFLEEERLPRFLRWLCRKRDRERAMDNLRPAFGDQYSEKQLQNIARRAMEHFAQLYLVELVMTPRVVNEWSWARHVELGNLGPALRELLRERGTIMITPHFGNFELLGYTIARLGLPLTAIMRPLDNPPLNEYLMASREAGGVTLLFKKGVSQAASEVVERGGTLCFIADQDAGHKGIFSEFFNRKASWYKSIGLLAMQHNVPIVVGGAARQRRGMHYRMDVERIIQPAEWQDRDDPLQWITDTFAQGLEAVIRRHPEQYLWMHRRWKSRPREERRAVEAAGGARKRATG